MTDRQHWIQVDVAGNARTASATAAFTATRPYSWGSIGPSDRDCDAHGPPLPFLDLSASKIFRPEVQLEERKKHEGICGPAGS